MWFLNLLLSKYFYLVISTHKTLWPNRHKKQLLAHGSFKNSGSKPVRGMFHDYGIPTLKEPLGTQIEPTSIPLL